MKKTEWKVIKKSQKYEFLETIKTENYKNNKIMDQKQ